MSRSSTRSSAKGGRASPNKRQRSSSSSSSPSSRLPPSPLSSPSTPSSPPSPSLNAYLTSAHATTPSYIDAHHPSKPRKSSPHSLLSLHQTVTKDPSLWPLSSTTLPLLTRSPPPHPRHLYPTWLLHLKHNSSILLSGFGSKKSLVIDFARTWLIDGPVVIVNGHSPHLTPRSLLVTLTQQVMSVTTTYRDLHSQLTDLTHFFTHSTSPTYLLIHSLDAPSLRPPSFQSLLSTLSSLPSLHLIATIDHVRSPLLWDAATLSHFRFVHWTVDTWREYGEEVGMMGMGMMEEGEGGGRGGVVRGIQQVVSSLTTSHRQLLDLIGKLFIERTIDKTKQTQTRLLNRKRTNTTPPDEMKEEKEEGEEGGVRGVVSFSLAELKKQCDDAMVGSGETGLQGLLRELIDHRLVEVVGGRDGGSRFTIQQPMEMVKRFYVEGGTDEAEVEEEKEEKEEKKEESKPKAKRGRPAAKRKGKCVRGLVDDDEVGEEKEASGVEEGSDLPDGFSAYVLPVRRSVALDDDDNDSDFQL